MAYASLADEGPCPTEEKPRALDCINDMARTAERTANSLQRFLDRFHGNPPPARPLNEEVKLAVPPGHSNQLDRLQKAIERLSELANSVDEIG